MKNRIRFIGYFYFLLSCTTSPADNTQIQVIELSGRSAEELIPLIKPMLDQNEAISGTAYQLILRTTPARLQQIKDMVRELDKPPMRLLITVHMGELQQEDRQQAQFQGQINHNGIAVATSNGAEASHSKWRQNNGRAQVTLGSTRALRDSRNRQQVQTLEGSICYIATGKAYPYEERIFLHGPAGTTQSSGLNYIETSSGFYALARLRSDQVILDISPTKELLLNRENGTIHSTRLRTQLIGALGQWLSLGEIGGNIQQQQGSTVSRIRTSQTSREQLWVKVERLDF